MGEEETPQEAKFLGPIYKNGRYENPWGTFQFAPARKMLRWFLLDKKEHTIPSSSELDKSLPIVPIDQEDIKSPPSSGVRVIWLGHASTLVQFDGTSLLTDPVFSDRCGMGGRFGPRRYRPCPVTVDTLPNIDAVVISHNHYDHLDLATVRDLNSRFGEGLKWFVPIGNKAWLADTGCKNVEEMTWWQESNFKTSGQEYILFACTPTQHWSRRGAFDRCKTLWSSWVIKGPNHSFFFGGDTGYCTAFTQIGEKYGPFTVAAIPMGNYLPRDCVQCQHVDPAEAVQIHQDVKATSSVGIHWGTFSMLSLEHYLDPPARLKKALADAGLKEDAFITLKHGEARIFKEDASIE